MNSLSNYISHRSSTDLTVADVFREYWAGYRQKHRVSPQQAKVVGAMMACRTPALGGRIDQCNESPKGRRSALWGVSVSVQQLPGPALQPVSEVRASQMG